jgi:hypothetical protein
MADRYEIFHRHLGFNEANTLAATTTVFMLGLI